MLKQPVSPALEHNKELTAAGAHITMHAEAGRTRDRLAAGTAQPQQAQQSLCAYIRTGEHNALYNPCPNVSNPRQCSRRKANHLRHWQW